AAAESEVAERLAGARVDRLAGDDRDRWVTAETIFGGIETESLRGPLPGSGESDQVAHGGAARHHAAPRHRQSEQLLEPTGHDQLRLGGGWAQAPDPAVLVDRAREDIAGEGSGERAAHHEAEVAWAARGDDAGLGAPHPLGNRRVGIGARFGKRLVELLRHLVRGGADVDGTARE